MLLNPIKLLVFLNEMRMFQSIIACFIQGTMKQYKYVKDNNLRICLRCKLIDSSMTEFCMDCKKAPYCNKKCKKKNSLLHKNICEEYVQKYPYIKETLSQMEENYKFLEAQMNRADIKKKN